MRQRLIEPDLGPDRRRVSVGQVSPEILVAPVPRAEDDEGGAEIGEVVAERGRMSSPSDRPFGKSSQSADGAGRHRQQGARNGYRTTRFGGALPRRDRRHGVGLR